MKIKLKLETRAIFSRLCHFKWYPKEFHFAVEKNGKAKKIPMSFRVFSSSSQNENGAHPSPLLVSSKVGFVAVVAA